MRATEKYTGIQLALIIIIIVIMLYFPYKMYTEHQKDVEAMAFYKK